MTTSINKDRPPAIVMNMFYTGIGIARSLGEQGIPVIGLTAQGGIYGNFTRYAKVVFCPDSRSDPEGLLAHLLEMAKSLGSRPLIFPTRDDDVAFLDRFRSALDPYFRLVIPKTDVIKACLDKWETYVWALRTGVPVPKCWVVTTVEEAAAIADAMHYPCVLKPLESYHWRKGRNWETVGGRKAIPVRSREEFVAEYAAVSRAEERVLVQELVPGGDDSLVVAACYLDQESRWVAGFNTQKLLQAPEGFGTGCIVQAVEQPELFSVTARLLQAIHYTGIAEVEYKRDACTGEYKLIEVNSRPWDQHRLGKYCGTDLVFLAYCEHAGLGIPTVRPRPSGRKWIAEDAFVLTALRLLWNRDPKFWMLFRLARGARTYAIWSNKDPLPLLGFLVIRFIPQMIGFAVQAVTSACKKLISVRAVADKTSTASGAIRKEGESRG